MSFPSDSTQRVTPRNHGITLRTIPKGDPRITKVQKVWQHLAIVDELDKLDLSPPPQRNWVYQKNGLKKD
jgi:hypothetical protein